MKRFRLILPLLAAALACGCARKTEPKLLPPVRVNTYTIAPQPCAARNVYVGVVEEESSAALSFPVMGTLLRICVCEGQHVRQGEVLAVLDDTSARNTCEAARAALRQAQDAYDRMKRLYEGESLPQVKIVEIETKLRQAQAACEIAEKNLADCILRAPFTGVVGKKMCDAGANVLPIQPVMTLLGIAEVKVRFAVPETEIAALGQSDPSEIRVAALEGKIFRGVSLEKGAVANPAVHTYDVRIPLANPQGELLPGMVCRVTVGGDKAAGKWIVPVRAVRQSGAGERFVWVVENGAASRRQVTVGGLYGNGIEILSGIGPGEKIVTDGYQKIGQGTKVSE